MNSYIARFFIEFLEKDCFLNCYVIAFYGTASPSFDVVEYVSTTPTMSVDWSIVWSSKQLIPKILGSVIHSFTHSLIHLLTNWLIHSFIHSIVIRAQSRLKS